ncbi:hypothetical protein [Methylobacillus sp. MM3]|uniref:hypothetical protein n=1 Tax=Methylobacillus sp. MM3 TaxID=1848039 RepID=UPI0013F4D3B5|nr:hypothetical protein [Methylobacillus sp. MM3]
MKNLSSDRSRKKRLIDSGVDAELVRLLCRWMENPGNQKAEAIFRSREQQQSLPFDRLK